MKHEPKKGSIPSIEAQFERLHTLQWRVIVLLILASLIPLGVISAGAWVVFGRVVYNKSIDQLQTTVRDHGVAVDLFLEERLMALDLVAQFYKRDTITQPSELADVLKNLNKSYTNSYQDLGVIDNSGNQLAYIGPYDLLGKNYSEAAWFAHVSQEGTYISDVFQGIRREPHFIMAVKKVEEGGKFWILRATINSVVFSNLVSKGRLGTTGDCFILDKNGRFQTPPVSRLRLLDQSGVKVPAQNEIIETVPVVIADGRKIIRTMKWIKSGEWVLVAQQDEKEISAPVRRAMWKGMAVFAVGAVIIIMASFFTTSYLFNLIEKATEQKDKLNLQLLQASKLASLGEMATGLAHEINNPLAIIATEQTNISDLLGMIKPETPEIKEMLDSVAMSKKQVMRCREITQKMLQFGRQHVSIGAVVNPGPQLTEIIHLMKQQARINNVDVCLEMENTLPKIYIDSTELQQLVVNIVNNAIGAIDSHGAIVVSAWSEGKRFHITIEDTGPGIPEDLKEKIFEPFFTTKPIGKGTGLGLAVCYGIAIKWRGKITFDSKKGSGARFDIDFPIADQQGQG